MAKKTSSNRTRRDPLGSDAAQGPRAGRGRTDAPTTPLAVRTQGFELPPAVEAHIHAKLGARLGKYANHIERVTARFEDVNGPRGGIDTECRLKVVLVSRPTILVSARGRDARRAFDALLDSATRAVGRDLDRAGFHERGGSSKRATDPAAAPRALEPDDAGEGAAAHRPPKPSRRSTRKSPAGMRSGTGLEKKALARALSPTARARRAQAARRGTR
jgi:ribosome-associated translation inhibitor RaiA